MGNVDTQTQVASSNASSQQQDIGETIFFTLSDWVLGAGIYQLDLQHNLETLNVNADFFENNVSEVIVDRFEILNTNTIRLRAPADPDCRFAGKAVVVAV